MRDYAFTINDVKAMPDGTEKAIQWLAYALLWSGDHHKQWFVERAFEALGTDDDLRAWLKTHEWTQPEPGIEP